MLSAAGRFLIACLLGIAAAAVAVALSDLALKPLLLSLAGGAIIPLAIITRRARAIFILAWVLSLTYFRVIFPIESMAGFQGFYVNIADGVFFGAMLWWALEIIIAKRPRIAYGPPAVRFVLPLVVVAFLSALLAQRTDWAMYEVIRLVKLPLILLYCRYNLGGRDWWIAVGALGFAVVFQSAYGAGQLLGVIGKYRLEAWDVEARASGTLAHPSILSSYLLLLTPLFVSLAIVVPIRRIKVLCVFSAAMGLLGLAITLSRIPWVIAGLQVGTVVLLLVLVRLISFKRAIGGLVAGVALLGIAMVPLIPRIQRRVQSDVDTSISWRLRMIEIGIENWQKHPMLGLGLANFPLSLKAERMEFGDSLDDAFAGVYKRAGAEGQEIKGFHWVWVTHNIYILLLAEIGTLGLLAFLLFVWWALRAGLHARRLQDPVYRGASIGLLVGISGVLLQMMSDWAIWLDPILYTFAIVASLLNNLPRTANEIPLPFDFNEDQLQK